MDKKIENKIARLVEALGKRTRIGAIDWQRASSDDFAFVSSYQSASVAIYLHPPSFVQLQLVKPDGIVALTASSDDNELNPKIRSMLADLAEQVRNSVNQVSRLLDDVIDEIESIPPF